MKKFTKLLALTLCAVMLLSAAACTGGGMSEEAIAAKRAEKLVALTNVYKTTYFEFPDLGEDGNFGINSVHSVGDKVYYDAYYSKRNKISDDEYQYENGRMLLKLDVDTKDSVLLRTFSYNNNNSDPNATTHHYENVNALTVADDETVWYAKEKGFSDWSDPNNYIYESNWYLVHETMDGQLIAETDLASALEGVDHFYVSNLFKDANGGVIAFCDTALLFVASDGTVTDKVVFDRENDEYYNTMGAVNGELVALSIDWGSENVKRMFKKLDRASKKFVDYAEVNEEIYHFFTGNDKIYITDNSGIYSYDILKQEKKELLNYINSDINSNRTNIIGAVGDDAFIATEYTRDWSGTRVALLEKASDTEMVEKYVIDFASVYLNDNLKDIIIEFNKQNTECRINYVDYSKYNTNSDYEAGINKLNQDIIKGNIPDIFSVEGLPLENYTSKNLIADLSVYMNEDKSFNKDLYLENILNITSENGKIFSIIPSFSVNTFITQKKYFGDKTKITVDDLLELSKRYPDAHILPYYFTRNEAFTGYVGQPVIASYVKSVDNGTGSFVDGNFAKYLEFVNKFPEEFDWDKFYEENPNFNDMNMYLDGSTLLQFLTLSTLDISYTIRQHGPDYIFVGSPVASQDSSGFGIMPECEIAVSAKSVMKDEAWSFIKYLFSDDFQKNTYNFPIKKDILDEKAAEVLKRYEEREEQSGIMPRANLIASSTATAEIAVDDVLYPNFEDTKISYTQADIDKIFDIINKADFVVRNDKEINKIIEEEAGGYFAGKKSATDVCSVIQGRVEQYIFENR